MSKFVNKFCRLGLILSCYVHFLFNILSKIVFLVPNIFSGPMRMIKTFQTLLLFCLGKCWKCDFIWNLIIAALRYTVKLVSVIPCSHVKKDKPRNTID